MPKLKDLWKKGSGKPAPLDIVYGGIAIDTDDSRIYSKDSSGNILELGNYHFDHTRTEPANPVLGQIWLDSRDKTLKFWDGLHWSEPKEVYQSTTTGENAPATSIIGDSWYKPSTNELKVRVADTAGHEVWVDVHTHQIAIGSY